MYRFNQIYGYGQDHPQAQMRRMLSPGQDYRARLRRRGALPPHTPMRGAHDHHHLGQNPPRKEVYQGLKLDEEQYGPGHWQHAEIPPTYDAQYHAPTEVLSRQPVLCPFFVPTSEPTHNRAAKRAGLDKKAVDVVSWETIHPHDHGGDFLDALFRETHKRHIQHVLKKDRPDLPQDKVSREVADIHRKYHPHGSESFPQLEPFYNIFRPLANEAQASETFFANVIVGARDAINRLIRDDFVANGMYPGIRVEIESQARVGPDGDASSALDFMLSLVSWPLTVTEDAFRIHLVAVEMKRPGYVLHEDWALEKGMALDSRAHSLATQLFWYTLRDEQRVERHLLSDYVHSVAVAVDYDSVHAAHQGHDEPIVMSAVPITNRPPKGKRAPKQADPYAFPHSLESPFEGGPRPALVYMLYEALRTLGVLNKGVFPHARFYGGDGDGKQERAIEVDPAVRKFMKSVAATRGGRDSPTGGRGGPEPSSDSSDIDRLAKRFNKSTLHSG
ncbi:hypothetical protein BMF94_5869 [Rhodotorula taiwanensis]|uniref:Uncharacterized protein n=1 Tax=Rhodotorula taiwanensis TaxID=741276 RepID=A0A2S5B2V2_9BASI|nr:hypothetical protein BMF94_5869 [Rhodotorula taiwanensis]